MVNSVSRGIETNLTLSSIGLTVATIIESLRPLSSGRSSTPKSKTEKGYLFFKATGFALGLVLVELKSSPWIFSTALFAAKAK